MLNVFRLIGNFFFHILKLLCLSFYSCVLFFIPSNHANAEKDAWAELKPYFLPDNHPIKAKLDRLFARIRATQSIKKFEKAGFDKPKIRQPTNIVIGKHRHFKDYIFKVYLDTQPPLSDWANWIQRIEGAKAIQTSIEYHRFQHVCVPKKWIYPLPPEPSPPNDPRFHRKNFILIAEKIDVLSKNENFDAFKTKMTAPILQELYIILSEEGLIDSVFPGNIPFTREGKIAFIDTEHHYPGRAVPYYKLNRYLCDQMQAFWEILIDPAQKENSDTVQEYSNTVL